MSKRTNTISAVLFLLLTLVSLFALTMLTETPKLEIPPLNEGYGDLAAFDFDTKLADLPEDHFMYYPEALYTPLEFKQASHSVNPPVAQDHYAGKGVENFGTYRILLKLPVGRTYGISAYSAMYSQRLFVNGEELSAVGSPAMTAEETISKTNHYTVYFTPRTEQTEILVQTASFEHTDGGGLFGLSLGAQERIMARDFSALSRVYLLLGNILMTSLFAVGMFLFFYRRRSFLWFACCCFCIGLRMLIVEEKAIMLLFPDLSWFASLKLEYLALIGMVFFFILYLDNVFTGILPWPILRSLTVLCGLYAGLIVLTKPAVYTKYLFYFQISCALLLVSTLIAIGWHFCRHQEEIKAEHVLLVIGVLGSGVLLLIDIYQHTHWGYRSRLGAANSGMMLFVLMNLASLVMGFARTEAERDEALGAERESREKNRLLESLNRVRTEFLQNLSHEMRTPLTVMSSYAGLTSRQIRKDAVNQETLLNLQAVTQEALRLADMVERIKEVAVEQERQFNVRTINAKSLLTRAACFCCPICRKNENEITVLDTSGDIPLTVNDDALFQVLVNLVTNANRHCRKDVIVLSAACTQGQEWVQFTVADPGAGIPAALLPEVMDRHVSGDGSSGLGLAICREIIAEHGGTIKIESTQGKGTTVFFTIPCERKVVV